MQDEDLNFARNVAIAYLLRMGKRANNTTSTIRLTRLLGVHPAGGGKKKCQRALIDWHVKAITVNHEHVKALKDGGGKAEFFNSQSWKRVRYEALRRSSARCQCCGVPGSQTQLHVDHIKPRSLFPQLALELSNLQVLCGDCNFGKGASDEINWKATQHHIDRLQDGSLEPEQAAHLRDILKG